jgi:putative membrane protein
MSKKLTEECKKRISEKIRELEKISAIEFVPVIAANSSNYAHFRFVIGLVATILTLTYFHLIGWGHSTGLVLAGAFGFGALIYFSLGNDLILSKFLPSHLKHEEVEEAARIKFLEHEIFATPQRTGVLIYISELEQSVFLLADKAILEKLPSDELSSLAAVLAQDLGKNGSAETFLTALEELSIKLAPTFPVGAENKNELSDHVRT